MCFLTNKATGGTVTFDGEYTIHTFTTGTENFFTVPEKLTNIEILVVAGGGAGGKTWGIVPCMENCSATDEALAGHWTNRVGGGGGAGGLIYHDDYTIESGYYTIKVGKGGGETTTMSPGANGEDSSIGDLLVAKGGGGGGAYTSEPCTSTGCRSTLVPGSMDGRTGGSGGGSASEGTGGNGQSEQGYKGGSIGDFLNSSVQAELWAGWAFTKLEAGGGGGAGGAGIYGRNGNGGGIGKAYNISGQDVTYASGGNYGHYTGNTTPSGRGGSKGSNGTDGLGNGGQGSGHSGLVPEDEGGGASTGGAGGSGIVIIRYRTT
jgi:hypothetical protein